MNTENQQLFDTYQSFMDLRELSDGTKRTYSSYLKRFFEWNEETLQKPTRDLEWSDIRLFLSHLKDVRKLDNRTINGYIAQLRDFYRYVLHKEWDRYQIPFKHFNEKLPLVPTREECKRILTNPKSWKHMAILVLLYSAGLRVSEVCALRVGDIHMRTERYIYIRTSKNRSDRRALLSEKALKVLSLYMYHEYPDYKNAKPEQFLFPGQAPDTGICTQTVREIFKQQLKDLGLENSGYTPKSLRHAFACHLYDAGVDIMSIKEAMGHKSLSSTSVYLTLGIGNGRTVVSPYDSL